MRLTAHFRLSEFTRSNVAALRGLSNEPDEASLANLVRLASVLERLRSVLSCPVYISSGYRSAAVNVAVGGAARSWHMQGIAADIYTHNHSPRQLYLLCQRIIGRDCRELLLYGGHVHVSVF